MKKWFYVLIGLIMFLCMGTIYSWGIFQKPLERVMLDDLNKKWLYNMPYTVFLFFYSFSMPVGGKLMTKFKASTVALFGSILIGFAWIISGFVNNIYMMIFTYGVLGGVGVGIVYGVPLSVVNKWFTEKKGLAVGLTLLGFGLSPFITAPLAQKLIEKYGVMNTFSILGVSFLIILSLFSLLLRYPNNQEDTTGLSEEENSKTLKEVLRDRSFYGLWICFALGTLAGLLAIGISSPYAQDSIGLTSKRAAYLTSFFAIFNGIGRPLFGYITDKLGTKKVIVISYLTIAFACVLLISFRNNEMMYIIGFSIMWLNLGGWLAIAPTSTTNLFGKKHYSENYGVLFTAYGIGAVLQWILISIVNTNNLPFSYVFMSVSVIVIFGIFISRLLIKE